MSDYTDFCTDLREWANRSDWSDTLVQTFVRDAEIKLNAELRVQRMIRSAVNTITCRCTALPDDWLENSLVEIANTSVPSGFIPIRYRARDEFFNLLDRNACNIYTIEGTQIFFGGAPDTTEGRQVKISYYGEVPVFSDTQPSWVYTKYETLYRAAALMSAYMHAVGEEQQASLAKQLAEDMITKLNTDWLKAKASGSRLTRTRTRSFG
jgi:hypothetical protein